MDPVTEETLQRVVFANPYNRSGFGTPKLDFSGRLKADECLEAIKDMRQSQRVNRFPTTNQPFAKQIHAAQMKYIARDLFIWCFADTSPNGLILQRIGHQKLNKTRYEKLSKKVRAPFARDIIHAFYNREHKPNWWLLFRTCSAWCVAAEDEAKYVQRLAESFKDAMSLGLEMKYRTATVLGLVRSIRESEDFSTMPILADALQDAGYDDEKVLTHYRDPNGVFTLGGWIFRATGYLEATKRSPDVSLDGN